MSDLLEQTMPGWRRDPSGRYEWRWWDGTGWTNRVANSAPTAPGPAQPSVAPSSAAPAEATTGTAEIAPAPPLVAPTAPAPPVLPNGAPVDDPFAALRMPRSSSSMPDAPPVPPVATPPAAAGHLAPTSPVRTYPSAHDGTSGSKWDGPYVPEVAPAAPPAARPPGLVARSLASVAGFFRSLWEEEESYHSPNAGVDVPPHPKQHALAPLPNYGRAGLVTLAAIGVAVGAYLPWITYRVDDITQSRTGDQLGVAAGFVFVAAAFSIAAMLGARHRVMGWATMGMSVVVAAMVAIRLLDVHEQVTQLNSGPTVSADIGIGLWVMLGAAAVGLVAAFRLDTPAEIV